MRQQALNLVQKLAEKNPKIVFIGSDLASGTLAKMQQSNPNQFFMEGISEQYVVGFAAGLAKEGYIPFINTIGTFLSRRSYEQICLDVALHKLPVRFLASGGGMVYAPLGPTHTAIEDLSLMLSIPNLRVFAPADSFEIEAIINESISDHYPYYIRLGKGDEPEVCKPSNKSIFKPKFFGEMNPDVLILTTGVMLHQCLVAKQILDLEGVRVSIIHSSYLSEIDYSEYFGVISHTKTLACVEEHIQIGGLFTRVLHHLDLNNIKGVKINHFSLPFSFSHNYGSQIDHFKKNRISGDSIAKEILFKHTNE